MNLAGGGHTLPEETGASRLVFALMACTLVHSHTHACAVQGSPRELLYRRDVELVRTQL